MGVGVGVGVGDPQNQSADLYESLALSSRWRLAAILLAPPGPHLADEVEGLATSLGGPLQSLALEAARAAREDGDLFSAYHSLLGPGGACPPAESDYDPAAFCNKGPLIADVVAFYRAFAFDPSAEWPEAPDHVAIECAFLSFLHFKHAQALHAGHAEAAEVTAQAIADFRADHLDRFLARLLDRLAEASKGHPFYEAAVRATRAVLG